MSVSIRALVYNGPEAVIDRVTVTLEDSEWLNLERFARYEDELSNAVYVQAGMPHAFSITMSPKEGFGLPQLPPDIQIREFLHLMRPFVLESEDTYFFKISSILGQRIEAAKIRARLRSWKDWFTGKMTQAVYTVQVEGLIVNSRDTLNLWLNAFEFHKDQAKVAQLTKALDTMPLPVMKAFFIDLLVAQAEAVQGVSALIRDLQDAKRKGQGWVA